MADLPISFCFANKEGIIDQWSERPGPDYRITIPAFTYELCDLGEVTYLLWALASSSIKCGNKTVFSENYMDRKYLVPSIWAAVSVFYLFFFFTFLYMCFSNIKSKSTAGRLWRPACSPYCVALLSASTSMVCTAFPSPRSRGDRTTAQGLNGAAWVDISTSL